MNSFIYTWEITRYLAWATSHIRLEAKDGNYDLSKEAENFFIPIFNILHDKKFEWLELEKPNYPAIDLGSSDKKKSIQVTSEKGLNKIRRTISKFLSKEIYKNYNELYHFIINEDYQLDKTNEELQEIIEEEKIKLEEKTKKCQNYHPNINFTIDKIWNVSTLRKKIKALNFDKKEIIRNHLHKEYGPVMKLPTFDDILIPYQVAFESQINPSTPNLPYQFKTPFFGRANKLQQLIDFSNSDEKVISIVADGGYGKTRLCIEFFKILDKEADKEAYVLNEGAYHCIDFSTQVKSNKEIFVLIDDAHRNISILKDIIKTAHTLKNVKLILTIRKAVYSDTLHSIPTHYRNIEKIVLDRLDYDSTKSLFESQFPNLMKKTTFDLINKSKGVPLVILALCQMIHENRYSDGLSNEENFKEFVLEQKKQVITDINSQQYIDKGIINKSIQLLSIFAPVKNNESELKAISEIIDISYDDFIETIDLLSEYDFINQSFTITIKPDPYSDVILLDSTGMIKRLLRKPDINNFIDRIIPNLIEIEHSDSFSVSLDPILFDFVSLMLNNSFSTKDEIIQFNNNLDTLAYFTYKKPSFSASAIDKIILSKKNNNIFWTQTQSPLFQHLVKETHKKIHLIFSIIYLNTYSDFELHSVYKTMTEYLTIQNDFSIISTIFRYRVYDFKEFGYSQNTPCFRQQFLANELTQLSKKNQLTKFEKEFTINSAESLLRLDFRLEEHFNPYKQTFSYGNSNVPENDITKQIRLTTITTLCEIYIQNRTIPSNFSEKILERLLRLLIYLKQPYQTVQRFNQDEEIIILKTFYLTILSSSPTTYERSKILYQIRLYNSKDFKEEYKDFIQELLDKAENVKTLSQKLELILLNELDYNKDDVIQSFSSIIDEHSTFDNFYSNLIQIVANSNSYSTFKLNKLIDFLNEKHPNQSKELFSKILDEHPHQVGIFTNLSKGFYTDKDFFYKSIDKIWNSEIDYNKTITVHMLTFGRKEDYQYYENGDFVYLETVIKEKNTAALNKLVHTIEKYMYVDSKKTINLIVQILNSGIINDSNRLLISSLFKDTSFSKTFKKELKQFIYKHSIPISLDTHFINYALKFLENEYSFKELFNYLTQKVDYIDKNPNLFGLSFYVGYSNRQTDVSQKEDNFIYAIQWFASLKNKSKYIHKKLLEFLIPEKIFSETLEQKLSIIVNLNKNNHAYLIELCQGINVYKNKTERLVLFLIKVALLLAVSPDYSSKDLAKVFGSSFIHNLGNKSKSRKGAYPQDIERKDLLIKILSLGLLNSDLKGLFSEILKKVQEDIDFENNRDKDDW